IPFAAVTRFVDPAVNFALSFEPVTGSADAKDIVAPTTDVSEKAEPETAPDKASEEISTVVNLDAFRRK
ncbi:MAG: ClpXP protease specificity-enhancing factor SspB, partial [Pseudomonadota bacterium]